MLRLGLVRVFGGALLLFALGACGGDDDDGTPLGGMGGAGGASGAGGAAGVGGASGASGMGGASGVGMSGMGGVGGDPYTCMPAQPTPDPGGSADEGEACCGGLGLCTANVSGAGTDAYGLDDCSAGANLKCVPNPALASEDGGVDEDGGAPSGLASCRMMVGMGATTYEGRCIPSCFLLGRATASLMQSTCDAESKCVPCYSPITGESTGACERNGDAPVEPAPAGFTECGDGNTGYCVPGGASGMAMLPQLTCPMGDACAPKSRVLDQGSCFTRCTGPLGPGACLPAFIAGSQAAILTMETCLMGELCIPCINPLTMMPTRACN
jgi:hypothetical protein